MKTHLSHCFLPSRLRPTLGLFQSALMALCLPTTLPGFTAAIDDFAQTLSDAGTFQLADGQLEVQISGGLETTGYTLDKGRGLGWFFGKSTDDFRLSPRLELKADIWAGASGYGFLKLRWDDGIHPGMRTAGDNFRSFRIDELFWRQKLGEWPLSLQIGRFTPLYGRINQMIQTKDNPFTNFPAFYEQVASVGDFFGAPGVESFANRRNNPDNALVWVPVVWAPLYTQGVQLAGTQGGWDYSLSFINRSVSSRSVVWDDLDFTHPTILFRLGFRPDAAWAYGVTFSRGAYLQDTEWQRPSPNPLPDPDDFQQTSVNFDFAWAHRHWEVSGEFNLSRFEVPGVGDADILSAYVQGKRALSAGTYIALRLNRQIFNELETATGRLAWDNDSWRTDVAFGWHPARSLLIKIQYTHAAFEGGDHLAQNIWSTQVRFSW